MTLRDLLKDQFKLFGKDIRTRLANKQIRVNGELPDQDMVLPELEDIEVKELGNFIYFLLKEGKDDFVDAWRFFGWEDFMGVNFETGEKKEFQDNHIVLRLSKKETYVIKLK